MSVDHVGTTVIPLLEEQQVGGAGHFLHEALGVAIGEEAVALTHDDEKRTRDLVSESFESQVFGSVLSLFGVLRVRAHFEGTSRQGIEIVPGGAEAIGTRQ
jgi:hypothetical protein